MSIEEEALEFAREAHGTQKRKYCEDPYIVHPIRVAELVRTVPHTTEMICAAYLHDVVEDTSVDIEEIKQRFGSQVASLVHELTDEFTKEKYPHLNRKARKKEEVARQAKMSPQAKTIKLADVIDNTLDIVKNDPNFARRYIPEMQALTEALEGGDLSLYSRAESEVQKGKLILRKPRNKH